MSDAEMHNDRFATAAPALRACLSPLGERIAFPKGIPFQSGQAKGTSLNATIGQVTDGAGRPLPLPGLVEHIPNMDPRVAFLYGAQPGHPELRDLWLLRQRALASGSAGSDDVPATRPFFTHGLTHGLAILADMFVGPSTRVILPDLCWENYDLIFSVRGGGSIERYPFYTEGGGFNIQGLIDATKAGDGPSVIVLNFPSNPTGYSPTPAEADALADALSELPGPTLVIVDDAYQGVVHEPDRLNHSVAWRIAAKSHPDRLVVAKVDGATKELMLFPSRVGFITFLVDADLTASIENKLNGLVRGTVGGPPGPSQDLVLHALREGTRTQADIDARLGQIRERYLALRDALDAADEPRITPLPFNSAYFATVALHPDVSADAVRRRLIDAYSTGSIHLPGTNALRFAYCSTRAEDQAAIVGNLVAAVRDVS